jgi:hypothetical protein
MKFRKIAEPNPTFDRYNSYFKECPLCGGATVITLESDDEASRLGRWLSGESYVQVMFPELSADEREILMTGCHSDCWDNTFKESETEDDN